MNIKEFLLLAYGFVMGTSTPYLKPTKRFLFPTAEVVIDSDLVLFLGGSGICAALGHGDDSLVINLNQGEAAGAWRQLLRTRSMGSGAKVVLTSLDKNFSGGLSLYGDADKVFVGRTDSLQVRTELGDLFDRAIVIGNETRVEVAGESVIFIPVGPAATESDLAVFFEKRSILFLGGLYFNHIHPVLRAGPHLQPQRWIDQLESLLQRFEPKIVVPAEGDLGTIAEVRSFLGYLRALTNPEVEFSECRRDYDWIEIPSCTSLEENFDLLRSRVKSHTTFRRGD